MRKLITLTLLLTGIAASFISCNKSPGVTPPNTPPKDSVVTPPPNQTLTYNWKSVIIGGGGYVTGMAIHPTAANVRYLRTDVGGAYRWDEATHTWIQLLNDFASNKVDGIALDANNANRVYLALNDGVYRSEDKGANWSKILSTTYDGNGDLRWVGECLAVDPQSSSVIYAGTRSDGLYQTLNDGGVWNKIASVPSTGTNGIRSVVIDPSSLISGRSANVYVGIPGVGIYKSSDGGTTFTAMTGAPVSPNRMQFFGGKLYVTHSLGVAVWDGITWQNITPTGGSNKDYSGLAVESSQKIVVAQRSGTFNNPMYVSTNGGTSWLQMNTTALPITKKYDVPWWPSSWFSSATSTLAFDPLNPGNLYYADWFGVWFTSNVWSAPPVIWSTIEKGHEEVCVLTLTSPSGGASVYSGVADVSGFRHTAVDSFPTAKLYTANETICIAFCESSPSNIAILGCAEHDGTGTSLATSTNTGTTWTVKPLPSGVTMGRVAISATDPLKMVYVASGTSGAVYYSTNGGTTWNASTGAPTGAVIAADVWGHDFSLASDGVDGNRFYLYKAGYLFATNNGGANWTQMNATAIPLKSTFLHVVARPDKAGEVWISLENNGLYKTTDGGVNFSKINAFTTASMVTWGAPKPGTPVVPTLYCYGTLSGNKDMYRSTNLGLSWDQISIKSKYFSNGAKAIAGDRQVFGRVYVGTGGNGVVYGQP